MKALPNMVASVLLLSICISTCSASLSQFAGEWTNVDSNTGGITKLDISVSGTSATVQAWGKCHPTDCDWGTVSAYAFAPDVSSDMVSQAQALMAVYDSGFSVTTLFIKPQGNNLAVQSYTAFQDSSRSSYASSYTFSKSSSTQMSYSGLLTEATPMKRYSSLQTATMTGSNE